MSAVTSSGVTSLWHSTASIWESVRTAAVATSHADRYRTAGTEPERPTTNGSMTTPSNIVTSMIVAAKSRCLGEAYAKRSHLDEVAALIRYFATVDSADLSTSTKTNASSASSDKPTQGKEASCARRLSSTNA